MRQHLCLLERVPCRAWRRSTQTRCLSSQHSNSPPKPASRTQDATKRITDEYANIREQYASPKFPIVLAHGLLGFDQLRLFGPWFPGISYWHGIREAFTANSIPVVIASVGPLDSIEQRAHSLALSISSQLTGFGSHPPSLDSITTSTSSSAQPKPHIHLRSPSNISHLDTALPPSAAPSPPPSDPSAEIGVNIIAHSMGGLDARHLLSHELLRGSGIRVRSLTTIATPHRGSALADHVLDDVIGAKRLPAIYRAFDRLNIPHGAWQQLTRRWVCGHFNPATPDVPGVRYFSFGAEVGGPHGRNRLPWYGVFRASESLVRGLEGPNDGLVSVDSARWGEYRGTLQGVDHLDLINWTNRVRWALGELGWGARRRFNAVAFYLGIADMLAKEGL